MWYDMILGDSLVLPKGIRLHTTKCYSISQICTLMKYSKQTTLLLVWQVIKTHVMNAFTCLSSQVHIFLSRPDIVVERIISLCPAKTRNNDWIWQLQLLFALVENVRQLYSHCTKKKRQNTILPIEKKKEKQRCWTIYCTACNKKTVVGQFTVQGCWTC